MVELVTVAMVQVAQVVQAVAVDFLNQDRVVRALQVKVTTVVMVSTMVAHHASLEAVVVRVVVEHQAQVLIQMVVMVVMVWPGLMA